MDSGAILKMSVASGHGLTGGRLSRALRPLGWLLDTVLPRRCLGCGELVEGEGALCAACWPRLHFLAPPLCACCGFPFEFDPGVDEPFCAACTAKPPPWRRARAVFVYDEASRGLILDFKHGDRIWASPAFGLWLARAGGELVADADLVAPVPLHRTRLFARRYNQSALLARAVARRCGLPVVPDLLVRRRATPSQGRLSPSARRRNVRGAFALRPSRRDSIAGRRVLLIDDVLTTGAPVCACARVLLRAGAGAVDVLTLARVARPRDPL
jgi:ComF family protein